MKNRLSLLLLTTILPLLLVLGLFQTPRIGHTQTEAPPDKLDPALQEVLDAGTAEPIRIVVYLKAQANVTQQLPQAMQERRQTVVQRLQETAYTSQQPLLKQLGQWAQAGPVLNYSPLWIVNAVAIEAMPEIVEELAKRPDVERIALDATIQLVEPVERNVQAAAEPTLWNVERVRARHVWEGLGITGEGVTVGIMDTGVDWLHPVLYSNYRGQAASGVNHDGNWFDVINEGNSAPLDPNGHGTHVAGTAVGANGIGIAPGAQWIAVRVFDEHGTSTISRIHLGFQWLLAPGGDPARAPNVINGSWGAEPGFDQFIPDIQALHQAGIITVFSAGNMGPYPGTINAPASYEGTIAVAATDNVDNVTWFSSRGPSSHTTQPKPDLAAPGALILSSLPNNEYGIFHGTSMAAPHVSGAAALLLSANPQLSPDSIRHTLTSTTLLIRTERPNPDAGWGRLDAYGAVGTQGNYGTIRGFVQAEDSPVVSAYITITTPSGAELPFRSDDTGHFTGWLLPGQYYLSVSAFGYHPVDKMPVTVQPSQVIDQVINMAPVPSGIVTGRVQSAADGAPLAAVVRVISTPVQAQTDENGYYSLRLPAGKTYQLRVERSGYYLGQVSISVEAGSTVESNFALNPTFSILLVDSGRWYYASQIEAYREALLNVGYAYDEWPVLSPFEPPSYEDLSAYDLVIWSAPYDSPGAVRGGVALKSYLDKGGRLLVSGENLGRYDGAGLAIQSWFYKQLQGKFIGLASAPFTITGRTNTAFAGEVFHLNGADSANNQFGPEVVEPAEGALTQSILEYSSGGSAGLHAGWCEPFDIVFFSFGLEGVSGEATRADLLRHSMDIFTTPPIATGLSFTPEQIDELVLPGTTVSYTLSLRNLSEVHTNTIQLSHDSVWNVTLSDAAVTLGPCDQRPVTLTLTVPPNLPRDTEHTFTVQASSSDGQQRTITVHSKTPGQILLVDDDRWYDQETLYGSALQSLGLPHDVWDTERLGSPTLPFLQAYEFIVWYTAYDWFAPVTPQEETMLYSYLQQGGRLFLTSQDYLYHHPDAPLTRNFLGVLDYLESFTPSATIGGDNTIIGDPAGPFTLTYGKYQNFSDGLVAGPRSEVYLWNNRGTAAGLATAGENWRTIFWGFPLETLPASRHAAALGNVMSWLGDVGDSTFTVTPRIGRASTPRTYTLTVRNLPQASTNNVYLTNTIPTELNIDPSTIQGGATFDPTTRRLTWQGQLAPSDEHHIVYKASVSARAPLGAQLESVVQLSYDRHNILMERIIPTWVDAPDLRRSTLHLSPTVLKTGQQVTLTATLVNHGTFADRPISATLHIPPAIQLMTDTLSVSTGQAQVHPHRVVWTGNVAPEETIVFTIQATADLTTSARHLPAALIVDDGVTAPVVEGETLHLLPYQAYMPITSRARRATP